MSLSYRRLRLVAATVTLALAPLVAAAAGGATWTDVLEAHAGMDLPAARQAALECVRRGSPADAVAAAGWWLENRDVLTEPDELLAAGSGRTEPELVWVLHQVDGLLNRRPPAGVLTPWE
ncbi:MAG TPA: hypothetical protein ENK19_04855, partial [Acidobacteria bacterium]|nr:hypothetical protein [Acidobacteriota bacterium]